MRLALFFLLIIAVFGILLATQDANVDTWVALQLPFVDVNLTSPLLGWIGGSLGVGFVLGYLVALPGRIGAARKARKIEKQLAATGTAAPA
ncbi:MAG: LapA family protein, partial [Bacteroidota bacterium]